MHRGRKKNVAFREVREEKSKEPKLKKEFEALEPESLCFDEKPNEETICALENSKLGIGVHKAKNKDDLFVQLKADDE